MVTEEEGEILVEGSGPVSIGLRLMQASSHSFEMEHEGDSLH